MFLERSTPTQLKEKMFGGSTLLIIDYLENNYISWERRKPKVLLYRKKIM